MLPGWGERDGLPEIFRILRQGAGLATFQRVLLADPACVIERRGSHNDTPLLACVRDNKRPDVVRLLLEHGAHVWDTDREGRGALCISLTAADSMLWPTVEEEARRYEVCGLLQKAGAELNLRSASGCTTADEVLCLTGKPCVAFYPERWLPVIDMRLQWCLAHGGEVSRSILRAPAAAAVLERLDLRRQALRVAKQSGWKDFIMTHVIDYF